MMTSLIWFGTATGLVAGIIHAIQIFREQYALPGPNAVALALYRAVWAVILWSLFGAYLLTFWVVGWFLWLLFGRSRRQDWPV